MLWVIDLRIVRDETPYLPMRKRRKAVRRVKN
jgi:ribosomal protein S30